MYWYSTGGEYNAKGLGLGLGAWGLGPLGLGLGGLGLGAWGLGMDFSVYRTTVYSHLLSAFCSQHSLSFCLLSTGLLSDKLG